MSIYTPPLPCIYKITNHTTGKVYIGSSSNIVLRHKKHFKELQYNQHHSPKLQRSWNKYGPKAFSFQIIEFIDNQEQLLSKERYYIDYFNSLDNGYNCRYPDYRVSSQKYSEILQRMKDYYTNNNEKIKLWKKQWYEDNKEEINRKRRELRAEKKALLLSQE